MDEYKGLIIEVNKMIEKITEQELNIMKNKEKIEKLLTNNHDLFAAQMDQLNELITGIDTYSKIYRKEFQEYVVELVAKVESQISTTIKDKTEAIKMILDPLETELRKSNQLMKSLIDEKNKLVEKINDFQDKINLQDKKISNLEAFYLAKEKNMKEATTKIETLVIDLMQLLEKSEFMFKQQNESQLKNIDYFENAEMRAN
jgi:chromosome segregation ATPase